MMDIAAELANYIDNAGFGTVGTDIFIGQIPEGTDGVYIIRSGGQLNNYIPIEESVLDVYIKDHSATDAIAKIENIKRFIHRMHSTEVNNAYIYMFLVIGDVEDVARDLEYEKIYKITVQVLHRDVGVIS